MQTVRNEYFLQSIILKYTELVEKPTLSLARNKFDPTGTHMHVHTHTHTHTHTTYLLHLTKELTKRSNIYVM